MSIVNEDKLEVLITSYGLGRISQCLADPTENINLSKMKFGRGKYNALTDDYEFYAPDATQTELKSLITNASFPLVDKALLEDEVTISLHSVIPETFSGYDFREVGLYETINGIDYLFALGTYQPIVKPSANYNYFMTVDFYIFLRTVNLADVYDQIILDSATRLVSETDLENLMRTILFVEGNLETQIEGNSVELGYNRASQLHDKITKHERDFSYFTVYSNYTDLLSYVGSSSIFSNWVFNYPRRSTATNAIIDISSNGYNLSTNKPVNQYDRSYEGIAAMLDFTGTNYFYLSPDVELSLLNSEKNEDISFSMMFTVKPADHNSDLTLLAKSNYSVGTNVFEVTEKSDRSLEIKLFADSSNYITYTSLASSIPNESHALVISYNKDTKDITAYVNGKVISITKTITGTYTHMNATNPTLYAYTVTPTETIYADNGTAPTALYNTDGTPYTGDLWKVTNNKVYYSNIEATQTGSASSITYYAWTYDDGTDDHTIFTKTTTLTATTPLYNANYSLYEGTEFEIVQSGSSYIIQYNSHDTSRDSGKDNTVSRYPFVYSGEQQTIWANKTYQDTLYAWTYQGNTIYTKTLTLTSSTALYNADGTSYTGSDFMVVLPAGQTNYVVQYRGNNTSRGTDIVTMPTQLFNSNGSLYQGTDWTIQDPTVTANPTIIYKLLYRSSYDSSKNITVPTVGLTSYITDANGNLYNYINSYVNVISVLRTGLSEAELRAISLTLMSTLGKNPCMALGE